MQNSVSIRVKNPEQDVNSSLPAFTDPVTSNNQWAIAFAYDSNSNLATKTDPRSITSTNTYDAMNRVLTRIYSNDPTQTPSIGYKYDGAGITAQNALGKLTSVATAGSFVSSYTYDNFDAMGRVLHSTQTTDANVYGMSYGYDLAGNLISETYPSGRVVLTALDAAGRINDVSSGTTHYVSSFSYAAHGGVTDVKLGNNLWEHTTFEPSRLQPTEIGLGSTQGTSDKLKLNYDYGALTTNNGNVMGQTITIPGGPTLTQSYTYDPLNRLKDAKENNGSSWIQTLLYNDQCGNRTIDAANTTPQLVGPNPQISLATNRITSAGYSYDFAGNLKTDAAGHNYDYDAENMQVKYDNTAAQYFYDGTGRRVKCVTNNGALTTLFVYDAMGKLLAEYTNTNPTGGGTSYLTTDALGSTRIVTGTNAASPVKARHDYLPFGEEITVPLGGRTTGQGYVADSVRQKFTGQLRDLETGLDYFGARYYSCALARFSSADSVAGNVLNPQSMNLYCYALGNPLKYVDPTGHYSLTVDGFDYYGDREAENNHEVVHSERPSGQQTNQSSAPAQTSAQEPIRVGTLDEISVKAGEVAAKKPGFFSKIGRPFKWIGRRAGALIHIGIELAFPSDYGSHHGTVGGGPDDVAQQLNQDLYAFGNAAGVTVRAGIDIAVDPQGRVSAQSPPFPEGKSTFEDPSQAPGLTGVIWKLAPGTYLPWGLNETADGGNVVPGSIRPPGHRTIYPTRGMPFQEFNDLVHNLPWVRVGRR